MKRIYVKPELEVVMFAPEQMLATSGGDNQQPVIPGEGEIPDFEGSNKRQNTWNSNNWE